jgi:hypothetical protein
VGHQAEDASGRIADAGNVRQEPLGLWGNAPLAGWPSGRAYCMAIWWLSANAVKVSGLRVELAFTVPDRQLEGFYAAGETRRANPD